MIYARQSTAIIVTVGPVLDADGVAVTGGVVGDFKISKNGGAPAALNGSATLTHRHTGFYSLSLTASDVDTVGTAEIVIDDTVNACPTKELQVVEEAVYDAIFAASAAGYQVPIWSSAGETVNLSGTTIKTATDVETDTADIQSKIGTPAALIGAATLAGNLQDVYDTVDPMATEVTSTNGIVSSVTHGNAALKTLIDTVDTVVDSIKVDTAAIYAADIAAASVAVAGSPSPTTTSFASNSTAADDYWNDTLVTFTSGTLAGVTRPVADFANANGLFTFDEAWPATPGAGETFTILRAHVHPVAQIQSGLATAANQTTILSRLGTPSDLGSGSSLSANLVDIESQTDDIGTAGAGLTAIPWNATWDTEVQSECADAITAYADPLITESGTAQAGAAQTITLATSAVASADYYVDQAIVLTGGTGAGQTRRITGYTSGRVATVDRAWVTAPDVTTTYKVLGVVQ